MKRILTITVLASFSFSYLFARDENTTASAVLTNVTVYRNGAELLHNASANLKQGMNDLYIEHLANEIDINSIQIKTADAVTIQNIEFSNNYLQPTEKSRQQLLLEDSLEQLQKEAGRIQIQLNSLTDLLDVLRSNKNIKGEQTGLSVAELVKLMDYYKNKSLELNNEAGLWNDRKKKNEERIFHIKKQMGEELKKNINNTGRLLLKLSVAVAGKYDLVISYIAKNAFWTPYYDVRVTSTKEGIKLVRKAKIVQTSGIDWKQVKLSLSTSLPSQYGAAPVLESWFLGYVNPVKQMDKYLSNSIQSLTGAVAGVNIREMTRLDEVVVTGYAAEKDTEASNGYYKKPEPVYIVKGAIMTKAEFEKINPNAIKKMDVLTSKQATDIYGSQAGGGAVIVELKNELQDYISVTNNTLDLSYDIDLPMDIPTNGREQTATLQTQELPVLYKHYSVPKLDKDAYLLAEVPDWEKLNLLPGEANIILEGTYAGKSFIDPNVTNDTLNLTLGRDKRVIVKREKVLDFKSSKFLGSNKFQKFTYELVVKNNKNETVNMLLKDQYPLSANKEIEIELQESSDADINKEKAVLNWKLNLAPGETKRIRYSYTVKYPRDKTLNL